MTNEAVVEEALDAGRQLHRPLLVAISVAGLAALCVMLLIVLVMRPISRSYPDTPDQVGALVMLAGSNGDRLDHALKMADEGVSDTLVFNTGIDWVGPTAERVEALCVDGYPPHTVHCVSALPDSTKGEAQVISELAEQLQLGSLGIVTSEFHMHRAIRWFERCSDADIEPVAVPNTTGSATNLNELLSSAHALLIDRSCFPG